jgi:hypothetical protein
MVMLLGTNAWLAHQTLDQGKQQSIRHKLSEILAGDVAAPVYTPIRSIPASIINKGIWCQTSMQKFILTC